MQTGETAIATKGEPQKEESRELIVRQQGKELLLRAIVGEMAGVCIHNFGDDPKTVYKLSALATAGDMEPKQVALQKPIALEYFYAHKCYLRSRTNPGEESAVVRCVLFDKSGKRFAFVSQGVAEDLARLVNLFGYDKFDPPISMQVVERKTGAGFNVLRLVPVDL